jgi:hypothetical protein
MAGWRDAGYEIIKIYFAKVLPRGERGGIVEYGTGGGEKLDAGNIENLEEHQCLSTSLMK